MNGKIVPVGFFGWPALLALTQRLFGAWMLPWAGGFALVSAMIPFYAILRRRYDVGSSAIGVIAAFSFPTMVLYANRGLFANGPVIAFGLWTLWMLFRVSERAWNARAALTAGALAGITLSIRPIEAVWLLPWWAWAGAGGSQKSVKPKVRACFLFLGFVIGIMPSLFLAWDAYGSPFVIGYWLREASSLTSVAAVSVSSPASSFFPFGLHPRNIWWNVRSFLLLLTWPWTALIAIAFLRQVRPWKGVRRLFDREHFPVVLAAWTVAWLLLLYGSGLYADHVRVGAVTIGNSFLRYLLPVALFAGWAAASLAPCIRLPWIRVALVVSLALFGGWRAFIADDEGLGAVRRELIRYGRIRQEAAALLPADAVIFSARSDKIFFPLFRAVSPIPAKEEVARFAASSRASVALFARPLSQREKDDWVRVGLEPQELSPFGRETLFRLVARHP